MDTVKVEEVIGEYVNIQRRGSDFKGLCPFHDEKTPSFSISPAKGIYKCFGCQKAGNAVTFLIDYENMSYIEAIRHLAKKYNIELEETQSTQEEKEQLEEKDQLYNINEYANKTFQFNLHNTDEGNKIGMSYFKERGFSDQTIKTFELGYSLEDKSGFSAEATKNGYDKEKLKELGLTKEYEDGTLVDFFRHRVMFPIHNLSGKAVGFGARTLSSDKKVPKYINSPETPIYHKSNILYGMHLAKKHIPKENHCILVEGYTDVISLYQGGVQNVVSSSGTSLTDGQLRLIRRFTENLYILYDGDNAGIQAALKGTDLALEHGLNVKLILLPENNDPDSFVKANGGQLVKEYIKENAQDIVTFKAHLYMDEAKNDPIKMADLTRDIIQTISHVSDNIKRIYYIKECSILLELDENTLAKEVQKLISKKKLEDDKQKESTSYTPEYKDDIALTTEAVNIPSNQAISTSRSYLVEKNLCKILIEHGNKPINENIDNDNPLYDDILVVAFIIDEILPAYKFESKLCEKLYNEIKDTYINENKVHSPHYYTNHTDPEIANFAIENCSDDIHQLYNWGKNNKSVKVKNYGDNYVDEVMSILEEIRVCYYEKLSDEIIENFKSTSNKFDEKAKLMLSVQYELINTIKNELGAKNSYVFRKR